MQDTTSASKNIDQPLSSQSPSNTASSNNIMLETPVIKPVAVARLRHSPDFEGKFLLNQMRCSLKKEDLDESCDGGSEFLEAISVAIDSLLLHHLQQQQNCDKSGFFEGSIRTKATLFSHQLLEDRGFAPVQSLSKDMASHCISYKDCLQQFAERAAAPNIQPGARDLALAILGLLGTCRDQDEDARSKDDEDEPPHDPWANIKMQI